MNQRCDDGSTVDEMERAALAVFCSKHATSIEISVARAVLTEAALFKRSTCSVSDVEQKYEQFQRICTSRSEIPHGVRSPIPFAAEHRAGGDGGDHGRPEGGCGGATQTLLILLRLMASFILVPLVTVFLLHLFHAPPPVAGFLVVSVCVSALSDLVNSSGIVDVDRSPEHSKTILVRLKKT